MRAPLVKWPSGDVGAVQVAFVAQQHPGEDAGVQVLRGQARHLASGDGVAVSGDWPHGPVPECQVSESAGAEMADFVR